MLKVQKIEQLTESNTDTTKRTVKSIEEDSFVRYEHIANGHKDEPIPIALIDHVFVNPN